MIRFEFTDVCGFTFLGPVQGAGGFVSAPARLERATRLARDGRPTGLYEPRPGCVAVFTRYSNESNGAPEVVSLVDCKWRVAS